MTELTNADLLTAIVTPFTAAVDIVTLPIVLPFTLLALKDMKPGF